VEYKSIKGEPHYIYDHISEFYNDHTDTTPTENWRNGIEGDWVWSDDKRIIQLLKVGTIKHPGDTKNYKVAKGWVRTVVGTFLIRERTFMDTDFSKHPNRYTFSQKIKNTSKRVKERKNVTKNERLFSVNVAGGMGAVKAYMEAYNEINSSKARKKAIILLKQERVMQEVEKSVLDVAKSLGLDHQYVLTRLKHLADYSEDDNIILQSTKEIGKVIGTSGVTVKQRDIGVFGIFQGFSPEQLEQVERKALSNGEDISKDKVTVQE
jgi:hypothetical protein